MNNVDQLYPDKTCASIAKARLLEALAPCIEKDVEEMTPEEIKAELDMLGVDTTPRSKMLRRFMELQREKEAYQSETERYRNAMPKYTAVINKLEGACKKAEANIRLRNLHNERKMNSTLEALQEAISFLETELPYFHEVVL